MERSLHAKMVFLCVGFFPVTPFLMDSLYVLSCGLQELNQEYSQLRRCPEEIFCVKVAVIWLFVMIHCFFKIVD